MWHFREETVCPTSRTSMMVGHLTQGGQLTNSMKRSPSWEADSLSLVKKFPAFYGNLKFISVFTISRQWFQPWARWIQSTISHLIFPRSILILSSHLRLGFPSGLSPSDFHTELLYIWRLPRVLHAPPISFSLIWPP